MKHLTLALLFAAVTATAATAQTLSLDEAIALALEHNRTVANAAIEVDKADHSVADARARRLPSFTIESQASQLLRPVDITFRRGAFGTLPEVGPLPAEDATIRTPSKLNFILNAEAAQPLTPLFKINLNVRLTEVSRDYGREQLRDARVALANQIRRVYFSIAQNRSALEANDHQLAVLEELDRAVGRRLLQQVALKSDALSVQAKIAQAGLQRLGIEHTIASQKEQLNQLIGRDVRTPFDVADLPEAIIEQTALELAQARGLEARPDVRQARLKLQQAEIARRMARTDYLPDAQLTVSYLSPMTIDGAPRQIASAAVQVKWEPFDWGRKGRALASRDLEIRQAQNAVRDAEDRAVLEINSRFRQLERARAELRAARIGQDSAREQARIRVAQYSTQAALFSDVLQAESSLADLDNQYQQALSSFWTARADFERALGEEGTR
ncbi:MAG TPA: TolC family protein [Vicinamibacterales bacterium]|nr:TolC family protein [Vicinamibacterales bacterium]